MSLVYIGLGSNLGDRVQHLIDARNHLIAQIEPRYSSPVRLRSSALYWSSPVGYDQQPGFINQVLELNCELEIRTLFSIMQSIEIALGRQRDAHNQNAPRVIDIDFLLFNKKVVNHTDLELPHPRMEQRLFVVEPLLELDDQLTMPNGLFLRDIRAANKLAGIYEGQILHKLA